MRGKMYQEQAQPTNTEKKYTEMDMLAAFKHGRKYEPSETDCDVSLSTPEKNWPFWDWLKGKYVPKRTEKQMDALINAIKKNLTSDPVCDSVFRCRGWEKNRAAMGNIAELFPYCPWCGKRRTWKEKP